MVRSAYFLGAAGVLGSAKNCAPLSAVASKASAGALEAVQLFDSLNLARTLEQAVADGWQVHRFANLIALQSNPPLPFDLSLPDPQVLGADGGPESVSCTDVSVSAPTLLVMGNEGYGLRTNVRRACTRLVRIEPSPSLETQILDSLNVSVATGILLQRFTAAQPVPLSL